MTPEDFERVVQHMKWLVKGRGAEVLMGHNFKNGKGHCIMKMIRMSVICCVAMVVALNTYAAAEGLPDILGIQLGMPARDAHARLQAALPKNKIQVMSDTLPTIDKPVIKSFSSAPPEQIMMGMEGDQVTVDVTLPPNKQAVWRVVRQHYFPNKGIPKTTLLASLREKYGKETVSNLAQGKPAADDSKIESLLWLFDEQGHSTPLPSSSGGKAPDFQTMLSLSGCANGSWDTHLGLIEVYADLYKGNNPQNDWCYVHYTAVFVLVSQSDPPELYGQMRMSLMSFPLALRASEATSRWKKDIAAGQHKQDLDKAKQQEKPKL
jgi:hypothetical protein